LVISALVFLLAMPSPAVANGRFPRAQRLLVDPDSPNRLVLTATYGLLVSHDEAKTWHHVCEAAFTDPEMEMDSVTAILPGGVLLASNYGGLSRASLTACDFQKTLITDESQGLRDFTVDSAGVVIVALATAAPELRLDELLQSTDGGRVFRRFGVPLPDSVRLVTTVDVAPADRNRIYLSGLDAEGSGLLLRSNDRGESFEVLPLPVNAEQNEVPYIAGIEPGNADGIYVRTDVWTYDSVAEVQRASDALLYSSDGGETFSELIRGGGKLLAFAFSPDGEDVLIGYGDPFDGGGRVTDSEALGIFWAPSGSSDFLKVLDGSISCLTWTEAGVFACTAHSDWGFSVGLAQPNDLLERVESPFIPLLKLADVVGPVACRDSQSAARCTASWEATCQSWGRTDCVLPPRTRLLSDEASGCGCRVVRTSSATPALLLFALLLGLILRRNHSCMGLIKLRERAPNRILGESAALPWVDSRRRCPPFRPR
jgi:MYXO-CTERM domain-containing protein